MDVSASLNSLQSALSITMLNKSMGRCADMLVLMDEMLNGPPSAPAQQLAPRAGSMDIRV